ncbi:MAG: GAF domain-containing protein [Catalinimonas sp.]
MAEQLYVTGTDRATRYQSLLPQIDALITGEPDLIANLANVSAALKGGLGFFWVGFYLVKDNQLVLGPFQGPVACTRLHFDRGVCGACYTRRAPVVVADVEAFPGHVACSAESRSEIVLPLFRGEDVFAVLDVDSDRIDDFGEVDVRYLTQLCARIGEAAR